jgi:hypothetical protein
VITSITIIITVILSISILVVPRKYFLWPFIVAACFIPDSGRVMIASLDFTPLRICVLFGVLRLLVRGEVIRIHWNKFDKLFFIWLILGAIIYVFRWGDLGALIYKSGVLFDGLGLYWIFRQGISSWQYVELLVKWFATCAIISALFVISERITHVNLFSFLGNVDTGFIRDRYRCYGAFGSSIIMGLFWASLIPWFLAYIKAKSDIILNITAVTSSLICVVLSGSSTPFITVGAILFFFALYRYRAYGRQIALGFCFLLFALHVVMKAPVWHLISRVSIFSSSTGWHRYNLIDQAIKHFDEWILFGSDTNLERWGWGLHDLANQYLFEGVFGGGVTLLVFIILLIYAVKITGAFSLHGNNVKYKWLSWGICVSILGHCVSFLAMTYFTQMKMVLYLTFAIVGFTCDQVNKKSVGQIVEYNAIVYRKKRPEMI